MSCALARRTAVSLGNTMRRILFLLALALLLPLPAAAQSDDAAYCAALSALAGTSDGRGFPSPDTRDAMNACASGNTAKGIPVLEKKLRASGFTLPKR